ncbi:MAG TPA: hypothetical protein VN660_03200 [Steroidobacteraceae bacterium]|nr:hypothetical protein [Steroidobacteraceae bacterium]
MLNTVLNSSARITLVLLVSLAAAKAAHAQGPGRPAGPPPTAQAAAPIDFTGYWESVVTQDWRMRMVTPRPGDHQSIQLKPAGLQVLDAWDPAKDTAAGLQCKSYGAPIIMNVPEHLHITWQDEQTLKVQTDAGEQTRLFHFTPSTAAAQGPRSWQGYSEAVWQLAGRGRGAKATWGELKVTTSDLKAGYLVKNGVPYSEQAQLLEYFNVVQIQNADAPWVMVVDTEAITDPVYLTSTLFTTAQFLKQPSDAGWEPSACSAMW